MLNHRTHCASEQHKNEAACETSCNSIESTYLSDWYNISVADSCHCEDHAPHGIEDISEQVKGALLLRRFCLETSLEELDCKAEYNGC